MNTGLIYSSPRPSDYLFGASSPKTALQPNRNWIEYIPNFESQIFKYLDTMACVTYSAHNLLETLSFRKFNEKSNWSDRFTAKMSGTTRQGNLFVNVGDSIRKNGLVKESSYPIPTEFKTWEEYYSDVPNTIAEEGRKILNDYEFIYEWVDSTPDSMWDALQYTPLQVAWYYGKPGDDDVYPRFSQQGNHAIMIYGGEYGKYWLAFDHYPSSPIKKLAWDSLFWGTLRYDILKKENTQKPMTKFEEGKLYQLVEGIGGAFLFTRGQMLTGEAGKVLFAWTIMNGGKTEGKVGTLLLADLQGVQLYDMSRKPIEMKL